MASSIASLTAMNHGSGIPIMEARDIRSLCGLSRVISRMVAREASDRLGQPRNCNISQLRRRDTRNAWDTRHTRRTGLRYSSSALSQTDGISDAPSLQFRLRRFKLWQRRRLNRRWKRRNNLRHCLRGMRKERKSCQPDVVSVGRCRCKLQGPLRRQDQDGPIE